LLSSDVVFENDMDELERYGYGDLVTEFWDALDFNEYKNEIVMKAIKETFVVIERDLKDLDIGIIGVELEKIVSPKFYNFEGDELEFSLIVEDEFLEKLNKKVQSSSLKELEDRLKEQFTSRDGFISYTANNLKEFEENLLQGNMQEVGFAIFWLLRDNSEDYQESLYEAMYQYNDPIAVLTDQKLIDRLSLAFAKIF